ncbi:hypothetical protein HNQ43_001225 [Faecalicoccus acidiformans]|uniref:Uncharacterized protein n=1 Tax=Faecalicoccus acidiformans TaxID=915173 RepID=A0A7W8D0W7_9FIRM|nr:hypothetical protein [Faecalicoccus acidiformans]
MKRKSTQNLSCQRAAGWCKAVGKSVEYTLELHLT